MAVHACRILEAQIITLLRKRVELHADLLDTTGTAGKARLAMQIHHINQQLGIKREQLKQCEIRHGVPRPVTVTLSGAATLRTTNSHAPGPYNQGLSATVTFNAARTSGSVDYWAPITVGPFPTPLGQNTTTVTVVGTPLVQLSKASGDLTIQGLHLWFRQSLHVLTPGDKDSHVMFHLTTGTVRSPTGTLRGSALDGQTGQLTIAGASQFTGGFLDGSDCTLVLVSTLSPMP